jgi:hypothetical protein
VPKTKNEIGLDAGLSVRKSFKVQLPAALAIGPISCDDSKAYKLVT